MNPGFIYLIKASNGLYKIGLASNVHKRVSELKAMSPILIFLEHVITTDCMLNVESALHYKFRSCRHHGEWFSLKQSQVDWIKSLDSYNNSDCKNLWEEIYKSKWSQH